ncbi:MAG: hypothetical protein JNK08_12945 [Sediminibacterium sp.]|nr:hypothetical protein [Sediminibacterium sp.]
MKMNKNLITALVLMILTTALYRVFPNRPIGFAPQMAVALFAGSLLMNNKKYAFLLPLISMLVSDGIYQLLYMNGLTEISGFYSGQWVNYLLIVGLTAFGFLIKKNNVLAILGTSVAAPSVYFVLSNGLVWIAGGGWGHPKTLAGLMATYADGLPFYPNSIYSTLFFSTVLFGGYALLKRKEASTHAA